MKIKDQPGEKYAMIPAVTKEAKLFFKGAKRAAGTLALIILSYSGEPPANKKIP